MGFVEFVTDLGHVSGLLHFWCRASEEAPAVVSF